MHSSRTRLSAEPAALKSAAVFTTPWVAKMSPNVYPTLAMSAPTGSAPLETRYPPHAYKVKRLR